jgi:hypothetical protein
MIKFPRVHLAQSVVNRILNTRDELQRSSSAPAPPTPTPPPVVPDPTLEGAELDNNLAEPPPGELPGLEPPAAEPNDLAGVVARGDDLISA